MPTEHGYPHKPFRANHVDIRTMQIFDPVVVGSKALGNASQGWQQMSATGCTMESGVRIKNTSAPTVFVSTTGLTGATAGTMSGFMLGESEEVFVEVRQLTNIWVAPSAAGASVGFIAS